jgi:hypothetical protein
MIKCPRCFHPLPERVFTWQCTSGRCRRQDDPRASAFSGVPETHPPIIELQPPPDTNRWSPPAADQMRCDSCGMPDAEICPTCHYELPRDWRQADAVCIALAGARATGKSVYLGVVIKLLRELLAEHGGSLGFPPGPSREIYQTHYEAPLFEARDIMAPTAETAAGGAYQRHPMICGFGTIGGRQRYLVIRDVSGEDLERVIGIPEHLSYFNRADAVFYMFDPTAVQEVRDLLRDLLPPQVHQVGDPARALESVTQLTRDGHPKMAMIMSKFDTMQALRHVRGTSWSRIMSNPGAAFQRDPGIAPHPTDGAERRPSTDDGGLLHEEIRSLLELLGARRFITAMAAPPHGVAYQHRFFAVSALGEPAEGERIHRRGIAPFRCLDPFRWALAGHGVF